jgi:glycosyltransferase involved in cell wall biosynthesis
MIVKNEEAVLARCLDSVKDAVDEIIIVDTGSTDSTKDIALEYTDKVYDFEWTDDFSAARNEAFSKATMDYQMWLDADDVIPEDQLEKFIKLKEELKPDADMVAMKYYTHFDGQGNPIFIATRGRMFRRDKGFLWNDPIHEFITLTGNVIYTDIVIHHKRNFKENHHERNISIYNKLEASGKKMTARQLYYFARELKDHGYGAKSVYYFEKFLDSKQGWVEDNIATCYNLSILYNVLGDESKIIPILTKSFEYDAPRAEICCELGYYYKRKGDFNTALKWFRVAADLGEPNTIGFILTDYWGYIPNIESCVCCFEMGDKENAKRYNEKAALFKPNDPAVEWNRKLFAP